MKFLSRHYPDNFHKFSNLLLHWKMPVPYRTNYETDIISIKSHKLGGCVKSDNSSCLFYNFLPKLLCGYNVVIKCFNNSSYKCWLNSLFMMINSLHKLSTVSPSDLCDSTNLFRLLYIFLKKKKKIRHVNLGKLYLTCFEIQMISIATLRIITN